MKKLLVTLVSVLLLVTVTISGIQLFPMLGSIDWSALEGHFEKQKERFTLKVEASVGGSVSDVAKDYEKGSVVDLLATPDDGYIFSGWHTEDDTYLTTTKNYSFTINSNTVLRATFAPLPEDMEGSHNYFDELKDCSQNFSFTMFCDRPDAETYLINNLVIVDSDYLGTEWEDLVKCNFVVERIDDTNEFRISLADGELYDPGTTYTTYLKDQVKDEPHTEHVYDNACDAFCNVCEEERETEDHEFDNACDTDCNVCGEKRAPDHSYSASYSKNATSHWIECGVCGARKLLGDHVSGGAATETSPESCTVCAYVISPATGHVTHIPSDEYSSDSSYHWFECAGCADQQIGKEAHTYDNACDAFCNGCGRARTVAPHSYDNACDAYCNHCGVRRSVAPHVYDNACDASCNVCGAIRATAPHVYDNGCDNYCNICGEYRDTDPHADSDGDELCDECAFDLSEDEEDEEDDYDYENDEFDDDDEEEEPEQELPPSQNTAFVDMSNGSGSMSFTIKQEETEVVEYNEGIVDLFNSDDENALDDVIAVVDDGLTVGEKGDTPDYLILREKFGLAIDSIVCVYTNLDEDGAPRLDNKSFYAKIIEIEELDDGSFKMTYDLPTLGEIFAKLDIYTEGEADLEGQGAEISEEAVEQIKRVVLCNENLRTYVAAMYGATASYATLAGYTVQPINKVNFNDLITVSVATRINGNKIYVDIELTASVPLTKDGKDVAAVSFKIDVSKELTVTYGANVKQKKNSKVPVDMSSYNFWVGVSDSETISFTVSAVYGAIGGGLSELEKTVNAELAQLKDGKNMNLTKVNDAFSRQGYELNSDLKADLLTLYFEQSIVTFNFDVDFTLRFDAGATLSYTSTSTSEATFGLRSSAKGAEPYKSAKGTATVSNLAVAGESNVKVGIDVGAQVSLSGFSKSVRVNIKFGVGSYYDVSGCANINQGLFSGKIDRGMYVNADLSYKLYEESGEWTHSEEKMPICAFGYDNTVVSYANKSVNGSTVSISSISDKTNLLSLPLLNVNVIDIDDLDVSVNSLKPGSKHYTVSVSIEDGSYLSYNSAKGELVVKSGAPLYFTDKITVTVTPKNTGWGELASGKTGVTLPTITLNVEYGNEDAYYDSIDTDIEKQFRKIYRNYNEGNTKILKDNFSNLINNAVKIPEKHRDVFECISVEYIDQLFDVIKNYRNHDDKNRTMENKFVKGEAEAFSGLIKYMNSILDTQKLTEKDTVDILELVLKSDALFETIRSVANSKDGEKLRAKFDTLNKDYKKLLDDGIIAFSQAHKNDKNNQNKAKNLADSFRKMVSLDKSSQNNGNGNNAN